MVEELKAVMNHIGVILFYLGSAGRESDGRIYSSFDRLETEVFQLPFKQAEGWGSVVQDASSRSVDGYYDESKVMLTALHRAMSRVLEKAEAADKSWEVADQMARRCGRAKLWEPF